MQTLLDPSVTQSDHWSFVFHFPGDLWRGIAGPDPAVIKLAAGAVVQNDRRSRRFTAALLALCRVNVVNVVLESTGGEVVDYLGEGRGEASLTRRQCLSRTRKAKRLLSKRAPQQLRARYRGHKRLVLTNHGRPIESFFGNPRTQTRENQTIPSSELFSEVHFSEVGTCSRGLSRFGQCLIDDHRIPPDTFAGHHSRNRSAPQFLEPRIQIHTYWVPTSTKCGDGCLPVASLWPQSVQIRADEIWRIFTLDRLGAPSTSAAFRRPVRRSALVIKPRHLPSVFLTAVGRVAGMPRIVAVSSSVTIHKSDSASTASSARPDRPLPFTSTRISAAMEFLAMSTIAACGLVTGEVTSWASLPSPTGKARHAAAGSRRNMSTAACDQTCETSGTSARFHGVSAKLRRLVSGSNCAFRNTSKSVPMIASPA